MYESGEYKLNKSDQKLLKKCVPIFVQGLQTI